jgi:hypothetical protein
MADGKRRSDRIMLTVRLRIVGNDAAGKRFKVDARAITLNRHGARIRTLATLRAGQVLRLIHLVGNSDGEFRVVGPLAPPSENGGEWGVECLNPDHNIWGIKFPPLPDGTSAYAKGLLECHRCHTAAFLRLSIVEVEVLESAGILVMSCETCGIETPWGYAESKLALDCPPSEARLFAEARAHVERGTPERDGRHIAESPFSSRFLFATITEERISAAAKTYPRVVSVSPARKPILSGRESRSPALTIPWARILRCRLDLFAPKKFAALHK